MKRIIVIAGILMLGLVASHVVAQESIGNSLSTQIVDQILEQLYLVRG